MTTATKTRLAPAIERERADRRAMVDTLRLLEPYEGRTSGRVPWDTLRADADRIRERWERDAQPGTLEAFPVSQSDQLKRRHTGTAQVHLATLRDKIEQIEERIQSLDKLDTFPGIDEAHEINAHAQELGSQVVALRDDARRKLRETIAEAGIDPEHVTRHTHRILPF